MSFFSDVIAWAKALAQLNQNNARMAQIEKGQKAIMSGLQHLQASVDSLATAVTTAATEIKEDVATIKANGSGASNDTQLDLMATRLDGVTVAVTELKTTVDEMAKSPVEPPA